MREVCSAAPAARAPPSRQERSVLLRQILGGELNAALAAPPSAAAHEVAMLATRAMEHHLERGLRVVALLERH